MRRERKKGASKSVGFQGKHSEECGKKDLGELWGKRQECKRNGEREVKKY